MTLNKLTFNTKHGVTSGICCLFGDEEEEKMATYPIPSPLPMCCTGKLPINWKIFHKSFRDYAMTTELHKKSPAMQVAKQKASWAKNTSKYPTDWSSQMKS